MNIRDGTSVYNCDKCSRVFDSCARFNGHYRFCGNRNKRIKLDYVNVNIHPSTFDDSDSSVEDYELPHDMDSVNGDVFFQPDCQILINILYTSFN